LEINHAPIDKPPWSMVNHKGNDRFKCPGCGKAVAWRIHGPAWRPNLFDHALAALLRVVTVTSLQNAEFNVRFHLLARPPGRDSLRGRAGVPLAKCR
jgi:hypothetical protein